MNQINLKYFKSERQNLPYEVEIPIFKFNHETATRKETIQFGTNKKGLVMYVVESTGYSTLRYEDLQKKFKALRYITESEFLKEVN